MVSLYRHRSRVVVRAMALSRELSPLFSRSIRWRILQRRSTCSRSIHWRKRARCGVTPALATSAVAPHRAERMNGRCHGSAISIHRMNLIQSNRHLRSPAKRRKLIHQWVKESSAIEGIHHPFAKGKHAYWPTTMDDLVTYWKQRVAAQSRARKASRAARSRGSTQRG